MGWITSPQKVENLSILDLVGPQLPAQILAYSGHSVKGKCCLTRFLVAVSGLDLCDWPVDMSTPNPNSLPHPALPLTGPCTKKAIKEAETMNKRPGLAWSCLAGKEPNV